LEAIRSYFSGEYKMRLLVGIIIPLVTVDGIISNFLVNQGLGVEANPFIRSLVGAESFLIAKLVVAILAALLLWDIYKRNPRLTFIITLCIVLGYTVIVYWNVFSFFVTLI